MGTTVPSSNPDWPYDPVQLMVDLLTGTETLDSIGLQKNLVDWMSSNDYNVFKNLETGEQIYAMQCKRGNIVHATRKSKQRDQICEALDGQEFDYPMKGFKSRRMTRMLFFTLSFDQTKYTKEEAWAMLRSSPIPGVNCSYGELNKFSARLSKIFGKHAKITVKEAQQNGYPAPHILILLDEPVMVQMHEHNGIVTWRVCDPRVLRRLGKDTKTRKMAFRDPRKAISINPVWKHGYMDVQGIIKGYRVKKRKNIATYIFKYLTKCLTEGHDEIKDIGPFCNIDNKGLKTTMYTHLGNKCFRTRDLVYGKAFKEKIGIVPQAAQDGPSVWKRLRTIPDFVYDFVMKALEKRRIKEFREKYGLDALSS